MENSVKVLSSLRVSDLKGPKRCYNESFEDFKKRREVEARYLKMYWRGKVVWQGKSIWKYNKDGMVDYQVVIGQGPLCKPVTSARLSLREYKERRKKARKNRGKLIKQGVK